MGNHLSSLLNKWFEQRDELQWVLATIIATDGSSYRKSGAMMMINSMGQYYGMLSGGCLESDIMRQARRCWEDSTNRIIQYDMREEEDLAWQLGIGCGGLVRILLQPVNKNNQYLCLTELKNALQKRIRCEYKQKINETSPVNTLSTNVDENVRGCSQQTIDNELWLVQCLAPPAHIAIFGGGADAQPLVSFADTLGWQVTLIDSRASYARESKFPTVTNIVREHLQSLTQQPWLQQIDAAILMNHNVEMDADSLRVVGTSGAKYIGILGPEHRTKRVFTQAQMSPADLSVVLANPVGMRLGGELPESIALSIISEIHAFLEHSDGRSISGVLS